MQHIYISTQTGQTGVFNLDKATSSGEGKH